MQTHLAGSAFFLNPSWKEYLLDYVSSNLNSSTLLKMFKKVLWFLLLIVAVLAGIIIFNTVRFSHPIPTRQSLEIPPINDSAIRHLSEAVRIKTISYADSLPIDTAEYIKFGKFLEKAYPLVHQKLPRKIFNQFSYLYSWQGKNQNLRPYVIMAHMDVVPVEEATAARWTVPPFSGALKDSMIWGRGVVDDKGCLITILEAVENLLRQQFQPERTIYLSFGHDEEISGSHGAKSIADWFKENNIQPSLVIDEGGEISNEQFPALRRPIAAIGVAEKGYLSFRFSVEKEGGHSSIPEQETSIDILSKALVNLRKKQMPFHVTAPIAELLNRIAPGLSFYQRMALANPWLFKSNIQRNFEKDHVTNSLFHTTIVPTILNSGIKDNVIPSVATAIVNARSLPGDSEADVISFMKNQINDARVRIVPEKTNKEASPTTAINSPAFRKIEELSYKIMPGVIPVPYLLLGGTDSYDFNQVSDGVIKFAPSIDAKGYHGIDERLPISDFRRMIFFYSLLVRESGN
jgi:carboxypeptidase PM20D1